MTLTGTIAKNAVEFHSEGTPRRSAPDAANHTDFTGVWVRRLTDRHHRAPGMAPSREKAKICREFEVMLARPQKKIETMTTRSITLAVAVPSASTKICAACGLAADSVPYSTME
jgi:hypothetical protein